MAKSKARDDANETRHPNDEHQHDFDNHSEGIKESSESSQRKRDHLEQLSVAANISTTPECFHNHGPTSRSSCSPDKASTKLIAQRS